MALAQIRKALQYLAASHSAGAVAVLTALLHEFSAQTNKHVPAVQTQAGDDQLVANSGADSAARASGGQSRYLPGCLILHAFAAS